MYLNKHRWLITSISFAFILANVRCVDTVSDIPPTPRPSTIEISQIEVGSISVGFAIRSTDGFYNKPVSLLQNDSLVASFVLIKDTVITRNGLKPKTSYEFNARHSEADAIYKVSTLDSTSHNVLWMVPDTLSPFGVINDIWVFDKNNIWAVGEFLQADENGGPSRNIIHNLAVWDGTQWQIKKIQVLFRGNNIIPWLEGIFAFSPNDIWLTGGRPIHGDGTHWTIYDFEKILQYDSISSSKLWGSSSAMVSFVGRTHNVSNYNNGKWSWSRTTLSTPLLDIYGVNASSVWAVGTDDRNGKGGIIHYDGTNWTTEYDNSSSGVEKHYPYSVWANNTEKVYIVGPEGVFFYSRITQKFTPLFVGNKAYMFSIRGTNVNDIFISGQRGELFHFNGVTWFQYMSQWFQNNDVSWLRKVIPTQDMVVVAGHFYNKNDFVPVVF